MTSSAGSAKGCLDNRFRAPPGFTAQLLTLHQHRAKNQYMMANPIQPTLRVSSNIQTTLEQSPIQLLTELNVSDFSDCMKTGVSNLISCCTLLLSLFTQSLSYPFSGQMSYLNYIIKCQYLLIFSVSSASTIFAFCTLTWRIFILFWVSYY